MEVMMILLPGEVATLFTPCLDRAPKTGHLSI